MAISAKFGKEFVRQYMSELGKRGGVMRAKKLSKARRKEIARIAGSAPKSKRKKK